MLLEKSPSPDRFAATLSGEGRGNVVSPLSPCGRGAGGEGAFFRQPEDFYLFLMGSRAPDIDQFDAHVVASILAISFGEAATEGGSLQNATGLALDDLNELVAEVFPKAASWRFLGGAKIERSADERCLVDLLTACATSRTKFEARLAIMMARRAQRPNHLWQDLGLSSRRDLSELMTRHFAPLARRNAQDMKWKKFFYRAICAEASYALCTAPSCAECDDFNTCFGEETGESLLARARRSHEKGAV